MKKLAAAALSLSLALSPAVFAAENDEVKVYLDGIRLELTDANGDHVAPVIINGTTYLPVRAISNALGLEVSWNGETRSVYLSSDADSDIIAYDLSAFSNLSYYLDKPYELLNTASIIDPIKELMGADYDNILFPMLSYCYALGGDDRITLYGTTDGRNTAAIDIYRTGRIDAAVLTSITDGSGDSVNVVRYYSYESPDAIDAPGIIDLISGNIQTHKAIEFRYGSGVPQAFDGYYKDVNGYGGFNLTPGSNGSVSFSGKVDSPVNGYCESNGTLRKMTYGCTVCNENGAPAILFAFSGDSLTVIGLNNVTKALTTVYKKA